MNRRRSFISLRNYKRLSFKFFMNKNRNSNNKKKKILLNYDDIVKKRR